MANTEREKLFAEFPAVSTEQWEAVITTDLKGADYERKLVWKTAEGFNVRPYYRAENLEGIEFLGSQAGEFPYVRGTHNGNDWAIHQTIAVKCPKAANEEALTLLNSGVNSLGFCLCAMENVTAEDIDTLLEGICIPAVELTFSGKNFVPTANMILAKVESMGLNKDEVKMNFIFDPIVKDLSQKGIYCCGDAEGTACYEAVAEFISKTADYKRIRVVNVSGAIFSNAGSTIVEELAFSLAAGHDYLVKLTEMGLPIDLVARKVRFEFAVTSNYFMEIAKFRAARMLWANIVKGYNPEKECASKMFAHAVTSTWNQTVYDPYVNMLR
ncbi:MAG: methylmalonyl-CoA mutase small subunit, partial [Alistipes sp.]|nr:methylmalonyl-CoA mutase small subunit [Alistipes sp.]